MIRARDVMTEDVETVAPDDEISEVLTRLARADFSGFPVVEDGTVVGVVTEEDLVDMFQPSNRVLWIPIGFPPFLESRTYGFDLSWDDLDVGIDMVKRARKPITTVMTEDVVTVGPEADLEELLGLLADTSRNINRLPVLEDGRLVGIVTRQDLLTAINEERNGR